MNPLVKKILFKVGVYSLIFGGALVLGMKRASAENLQADPKDLLGNVAEHYIKNINVPLPKIADIPLPEQLDLGWKKSEYRFNSDFVINFKTTDPLDRINITQGNHNYQITQDGFMWRWTKVLD